MKAFFISMNIWLLLTLSCAEEKPTLTEGSYVLDEVIISFHENTPEKEKQRILSIGTARPLGRPQCVLVKIKNGMTVEQVIDLLEKDPNIESVEPNWLIHLNKESP